ncbi:MULTISPECIES: sensor histidine kinase [Paraliobacillus]|uniref:sensor histidine kinase n=1 Tax=Paraliobacillus TaxID=200903 RepID=UPI000DD2BD8D|nr:MULTISPECIES: sensor histidine kinase [Paraliobacillus]
MKKTEGKALDEIITEMVEVVEHSKDGIYTIGEESRTEHQLLMEQLEEIKLELIRVIDEVDSLEKKTQLSRNRLAEVSHHFSKYGEEEIREVYEQTHQLQSDLKLKQTSEKNLRQKRDEIERRLKTLEQTIERADGLVSKVSIVLNYLNEDFQQVNELVQDANEKQAFGLKIIQAQEDERKRLSREMHDGPAQMLANILLRSEIVDKTFKERGREEALSEMKGVRSLVRSSLYEVRRIIYDLRPMALDDLGLLPTIKKYLNNIEEYNQTKIVFTALGKTERLASKYEVALFRLIQEAVQNAIKHAQAEEINVKLEITSKVVSATISDNGNGFDQGLKEEHSFGLIGMHERVELLDGTLKIQSELGKGTRILINVPLNE